MEYTAKLLGGSKQVLHTGTAAWTAPAGFAAFALECRVDAVHIDTLSEIKQKGVAAAAVTTYTWENVDVLLTGEQILFDFPVTSITLKNATDSIWLFLEPFNPGV